jgi:hypothetical protein
MLGIMCFNPSDNLRRELINIKEGSICCICCEHGKIKDAYWHTCTCLSPQHHGQAVSEEGWHIPITTPNDPIWCCPLHVNTSIDVDNMLAGIKKTLDHKLNSKLCEFNSRVTLEYLHHLFWHQTQNKRGWSLLVKVHPCKQFLFLSFQIRHG